MIKLSAPCDAPQRWRTTALTLRKCCLHASLPGFMSILKPTLPPKVRVQQLPLEILAHPQKTDQHRLFHSSATDTLQPSTVCSTAVRQIHSNPAPSVPQQCDRYTPTQHRLFHGGATPKCTPTQHRLFHGGATPNPAPPVLQPCNSPLTGPPTNGTL